MTGEVHPMRYFTANTHRPKTTSSDRKATKPIGPAATWSPEARKAAAHWSTPEAVRERQRGEADSQGEWYGGPFRARQLQEEPFLGVSPMLYEGNFSEWQDMMELKLRQHGLWLRVKRPLPTYIHVSAATQDQIERDDIWAVNIMLDHLGQDFSSRLNIERPVTGNQLLRDLEKAAQPFRLMDLPRKLRDKVYEINLVVPQDRRWRHWDTRSLTAFSEEHAKRMRRQPKTALHKTVDHDAIFIRHPPLLETSQQVREEGNAVYWGQNEWQVNLDSKIEDENGMWLSNKDLGLTKLHFQEWVTETGMHRLKHLRDFTLGVEICHKSGRCNPEEHRIQLDERRGLTVHGVVSGHHHGDVMEDLMGWQVAVAEMKRKSKGWKGESIIDYFMEDTFWTSWCFTRPNISDEEWRTILELGEGVGEWWSTR